MQWSERRSNKYRSERSPTSVRTISQQVMKYVCGQGLRLRINASITSIMYSTVLEHNTYNSSSGHVHDSKTVPRGAIRGTAWHRVARKLQYLPSVVRVGGVDNRS